MPGVDLNITLPTVGATLGPTWASDLNTAIQTIIDDIEPLVVASEININADLEMNLNNLTETTAVQFDTTTGVLTGGANANKVHFSSGEFFVVDGTGASVRITSGGAIDVSTTGGWTGDYAADPATASYTAASDTFSLLQDPGVPGILTCGDIEVQRILSPGFNVTLRAPTLAGDVVITLPVADSSSANSVVAVDASNILSFTDSPTINNPTVPAGGTLATTTATVTATDREHLIQAIAAASIGSAGVLGSTGAYWQSTDGSFEILLALDIDRWSGGITVTDWTANVRDIAANTVTIQFRSVTNTGTTALINSAVSDGVGSDQIISPAGFSQALSTSTSYFFRFTVNAGASRFYNIRILYNMT